MYQTVWTEIDLSALARNIRKAKEYLNPSSSLCGVVKADGYGHGAVRVAQIYQKEGIQFFAVSNLREALELRSGNIRGEILVLGWTPSEGFRDAVLENISLTVFSGIDLALLSQAAKSLGKKAKVHLKMETGMNRLGAAWNGEILDLAKEVRSFPDLEILGVFSHFSSADIKDSDWVMEQFRRFTHGLDLLQSAGISPGLRHICNSAGLMYYPETHLDMVRLGGGAFGMGIEQEIGLEPVMTFKVRVSYIKELPPDESVGYGRTFKNQRVRKIATLPVGYADGWTWAMRKYVFNYKGRQLPTLGNICMDQMMVDLSDWPECQVGDEIVLMGPQNASIKEIAEYAGVTEYEIPTRIGKRVQRIYRD